jgi:trk system potassium uptake protein TrkH
MLRRYIKPIDLSVVFYYLSELIGVLGIILVVPLAASLFFKEYEASLLLAAMILAFYGFSYLINKLQPDYLKKPALRDALIVTALIYLVYSFLGGIVFKLVPNHSYIDGVFEVMSGLTTTGLTLFNPETLPKTLVFFRSYTQWLGGLGIIIISLALLFRPGGAPFKLYASEFGEENIVGSVVKTSRTVIKIYAVLTAAGFVLFVASGMGLYDGLIHIMSAISTGGFTAYRDSIGHYGSPIISLSVCLVMFLGAVSFPLYYKMTKRGIGDFFKDIQVRTLFIIIVVSSVLFFINFGFYYKELIPSVFQSITSISTTGFNTIDTLALSDKSKYITILLMIAGGSMSSTAGGIKILRFIVLISALRWLVWKNSLPEETKLSMKVGRVEISSNTLSVVMGLVTAYMLILFFSTLALMYIENFSFVDSLFEVASAQGTVGLSVGITRPNMHVLSKLLFIFDMWVGRLEIIPVLILLSPMTWLKSAKKKNGIEV